MSRVDAWVRIRISGSEEDFRLPADLEAFEPAAEGEYRLRDTGEIVVVLQQPSSIVPMHVRRAGRPEGDVAAERKPPGPYMPRRVLDHDPERKLAISTPRGSRRLVETRALEVEKGQIVLIRPAPDSPLPVRSADPQHEENSSTDASDKEDEGHDRRVRGILRRSPTGGTEPLSIALLLPRRA